MGRLEVLGSIDINELDIFGHNWIEILDMKIFFRDKIPESKLGLRPILVDIKELVCLLYIENTHSIGRIDSRFSTSPLTSLNTTVILYSNTIRRDKPYVQKESSSCQYFSIQPNSLSFRKHGTILRSQRLRACRR